MKKVMLYSGGSDSYMMSKIVKPDIRVYFNIHGRYSDTEISKLDKDVVVVDLPLGQYERDNAIVPLRNLYFIMEACNLTEDEDVEIYLGATSGDRVLDKSVEFVKKAEEILNYLYQPQWWIPEGKKVKINIDFKTMTKTQILKKFIECGNDINDAWSQSFSCYNPVDGHECWECKPCFRKFVAFALNGMKFDKHIVEKVINYINCEIKPQIDAGTYGRADEEKEILQVLDLYNKGLLY